VNVFIAEFWQQVFPNLTLNKGATLRTGGEIGIAVRKNNPKLLNAVNAFIKKYGRGPAFGNMMEKRYLQKTTYVKGANSEAERAKLFAMAKLFQTYGARYSVDYVMMAATGLQGSGAR